MSFTGSGGRIGTTITGGIQDIAAILPLLGTEQCSVQVSSALTRGYLYAAATPMSIFGSLGVVTAGFKTLAACFSFGNIEGAKILGNMGFEPQGENLSLIMVETGKGKNAGRYIIETRMDDLIRELSIEKDRITGVSHKSVLWNLKMIATTALFCAFSMAPYIYLNMGANNLDESTTWLFPVLRATGGFITTTLIQLLVQRRITTLSTQYLVKRDPPSNTDVEAGVETKKHQVDACTWLLLCLLLIGLVASVVGYVGCFSVVQNSMSSAGPVSWLCLEAGLSVLRLVIWACNPTSDDAPPLEIILKLDEYSHKPLPTCNKDNEEILRCKVLPLTRARDFLKMITSFAGLIEPFTNPQADLSLYYTLTRKRPFEKTDGAWEIEAKKYKLGERTLYITVFDHKERTTRVYTRDNESDIFYSTKSDAPLVDVGHFVLEVEIDAKIDPTGDPVSSDSCILDSLRKHYQSILEHIHYRLGSSDITKPYAIENSWTMKVENTFSPLQKSKEDGNVDDWGTVVEIGKKRERNEENKLLCDYFMHSSIEKDRRSLDWKRVKWIARRMEMIANETKAGLQGIRAEYRVDMQAVENKATKSVSPREVDSRLFDERNMMERLLVSEANEWEQLFWIKFTAFRDEIGKDRVDVKERLTREWKADCWRRLNPQMHAAEKRMADIFSTDYVKKFLEQWTSISQLIENPTSTLLSELKEDLQAQDQEIRLRMEKEIEDTEFRLKRGSELRRFDQFWDDDTLFICRYSRSKWVTLDPPLSITPHDIYSHALKGNKNIIHITFGSCYHDSVIEAMVCDKPWVTSISRKTSGRSGPPAPVVRRDLLFNEYMDNSLTRFAERVRPQLDKDDSTYIFLNAGSSLYARALISFVAPTSGQSLTLRVKHSGGLLVVTLGSTTIQLNPSSKSSLTIDDITLYPNPGPDRLSFVAGRNSIVIPESDNKYLHDIELLDDAGLKDPRNQIITADRTDT